jgi:hypothetical protein
MIGDHRERKKKRKGGGWEMPLSIDEMKLKEDRIGWMTVLT